MGRGTPSFGNCMKKHRYFEAYNNKEEAIFDEIIAPDTLTMAKPLIWAIMVDSFWLLEVYTIWRNKINFSNSSFYSSNYN